MWEVVRSGMGREKNLGVFLLCFVRLAFVAVTWRKLLDRPTLT